MIVKIGMRLREAGEERLVPVFHKAPGQPCRRHHRDRFNSNFDSLRSDLFFLGSTTSLQIIEDVPLYEDRSPRCSTPCATYNRYQHVYHPSRCSKSCSRLQRSASRTYLESTTSSWYGSRRLPACCHTKEILMCGWAAAHQVRGKPQCRTIKERLCDRWQGPRSSAPLRFSFPQCAPDEAFELFQSRSSFVLVDLVNNVLLCVRCILSILDPVRPASSFVFALMLNAIGDGLDPPLKFSIRYRCTAVDESRLFPRVAARTSFLQTFHNHKLNRFHNDLRTPHTKRYWVTSLSLWLSVFIETDGSHSLFETMSSDQFEVSGSHFGRLASTPEGCCTWSPRGRPFSCYKCRL